MLEQAIVLTNHKIAERISNCRLANVSPLSSGKAKWSQAENLALKFFMAQTWQETILSANDVVFCAVLKSISK